MNNRRGCRFIKAMVNTDQRLNWTWGNVAKSYMTHQQDQLMTVSQKDFIKAYSLATNAISLPKNRWLSIQILNRTIWTNFKQYL